MVMTNREKLAWTGRLLINKGFQEITDLSVALFLEVPDSSVVAVIQNQSDVNIRYRDDGTAPTATTGMILYPGETYPYEASIDSIQFIQEESGAKLAVSYYG